MRDLFVCYAGIIRSKMAAEIARELAREKGLTDYVANNLSIGEACMAMRSGTNYSRIFVMEMEFMARLMQNGVPAAKIYILDVTGELQRPRDSVRKELEDKLAPYFK